jgi:rfaE bifunctional protein kinase chain/domain
MSHFAQARLLVVGDLMLDRYWFGDVERISPEAPVPVVRVQRVEERLGGAANVARNAATLGCATTLAGIVGDDEPGRCIEALTAQAGITAQLWRDPKLPTTIKLRVIGRQQQLIRVDFEAQPEASLLDAKLAAVCALIANQDVLILSDYGKGALHRIESMIAAAKQARIPVIADPKGEDYARYAGATLLTPNRAELRAVVGRWVDEEDLTNRAQNLRQSLALDHLLLTRSEEGMTLFSSQGTFHVPAQAREVFDVSGAGDTVVAVLGAMLARGETVEQAVRLANRAGGIVVGKLGTVAISVDELFAGEPARS